ncbi:NADPH-dependent FMN reductase [Luteipulveratus flavus]|uniref:NAD(P)H-dependent oxidoreductase n=1 Tax=Luteipulveratus flavus TaxID=3031728 RepID=A0ABT6C486_9MICO|nr:NAD(P)H-dependent oxidoreductase [Luteipulveratus sp. YIM 133296]MDF8263692.1 NAD(P)H-dependent oxidoreductase [Luteipulveratus sp. YIM 133296]
MDNLSTSDQPVRLAVVVGSTRPGRRGPQVAEWLREAATTHLGERATLEVVDLARFGLPLLDEPMPAAIGDYRNSHTKTWAATIDQFDGFVFVAPEYNHSMPAALKNAIDFLFAEWNNKAAGFVSYGLNGGTRAVEHLRLSLAEVQVATVRSQVALGLFTDFDIPDMTQPGTFAPADHHDEVMRRMLDELADWALALRLLRERAGR